MIGKQTTRRKPQGTVSMKATDAHVKFLNKLVTLLRRIGVTRSSLSRLFLGPLLSTPETTPSRKHGHRVWSGPFSAADADLLFDDKFYAASDRLMETGEVVVAVIAGAQQQWYLFFWCSDAYIFTCRLRELDRAAAAAESAVHRDKPDQVITTVLSPAEKQALIEKTSALGLRRSPIGHCRAAALLLKHFLESCSDYGKQD